MHNVLLIMNINKFSVHFVIKKSRNVFSNNTNIPTLKKFSLLAKITPKRA